MDILPDLTPRQLRRIKAYRPKGGVWHRIAAELDELTGMDPFELRKQKIKAEKTMEIIDESPRPWRDLVNDFNPIAAAECAGKGMTHQQARERMLAFFGDPYVRY